MLVLQLLACALLVAGSALSAAALCLGTSDPRASGL